MNTNHSDQIQKASRSPITHVFVVKLAPETSRGDCQRYFRRMQRDMARVGLIMNHSAGICMAVKDRDVNWRTDRHLFMNWVTDQPQSRQILVADPVPLMGLLDGEYSLQRDFVRLSLRGEMVSPWLITKVLTGLMTRAINRLQIESEARHVQL